MNTIQTASNQWAKRPADERFTSLTEMRDFCAKVKHESRQTIAPTNSLRFEAAGEDGLQAYLAGEKKGGKFVKATRFDLTHSSFNQVCNRIQCPAEFMRRLPNKLAAQNLNHCAENAKTEQVQVLSRENGTKELRAVTSEKYGRIWNADILTQVVEEFGDGITGQFSVPGEFGKKVQVNKDNTTFYASDHDIFVFLTDEENRIELPNRRNGEKGSLARGFYFWNSETGHQTFGCSTFYFDYVCANRIIWNTAEVQQIKMRHSKFAPERFERDVIPALKAFTKGHASGIKTAIEEARKYTFEAPELVLEMLEKQLKFPKKTAGAILSIHHMEEEKPIENVFDLVTGITAFARGIAYQDERVAVEAIAGDLLRKFAA